MVLWRNVHSLFSRLPKPTASFKRELVHLLCVGLDVDAQQGLTGIHDRSTLSRYVNEEIFDIRLLSARYRSGVTRDRSGASVEALEGYLAEKYNAAKSGDHQVRLNNRNCFSNSLAGPCCDRCVTFSCVL